MDLREMYEVLCRCAQLQYSVVKYVTSRVDHTMSYMRPHGMIHHQRIAAFSALTCELAVII